jgi:hypothetical protein
MPGDFSSEAYEQLHAAYAKETNTQLDAESEGVKVGGQEMTLETLPVDSPWKSKIDNWEYPTGRSQYLDGKQDPAEILAIMRGAAQEIDDAEKLEEARELVAEAEETEEVEEPAAETEEVSDEDLGEMSDEEFEKYVDELLNGVGDEEELEDEEEEAEEEETEEPVAEVEAEVEETEEEAEEEEAEEEEAEDEEYDPQAVADEISRLKDELENMRFVPTEEQPEANDESD